MMPQATDKKACGKRWDGDYDEMSTTTLIYFWGIADNVSSILQRAATVSAIFAAALLLFTIIGTPDGELAAETKRYFRKWISRLIPLSVIFCVLWTATPSSNTIAMMYVIPEIAKSDVVKKDLPEVYEAAKKALLENLRK